MSPEPIQVIVCATDFSDASRRALERAIDLARRYGVPRVVLLHVAEVVERVADTGTPDASWMIEWNRYEEVEAAKVRKAAEAATAEHGIEVVPDFRSGRPWRAIVNGARELGADLLVIGTHGRSGLERALMGSVAERVVRHAPCTVVVARPRGDHA